MQQNFAIKIQITFPTYVPCGFSSDWYLLLDELICIHSTEMYVKINTQTYIVRICPSRNATSQA